MDQSAALRTDHPATEQDALAELPAGDFVRRWRQITGEPPAILLSSRSEMIALLVESVPMAPLTPQGESPGTAGLGRLRPKIAARTGQTGRPQDPPRAVISGVRDRDRPDAEPGWRDGFAPVEVAAFARVWEYADADQRGHTSSVREVACEG